MEWINRLNNAMSYVEKHLTDTVDPDDISLIMASPFSVFLRFFIQITDIPFSEYIRRRKLSCAAYEIRNSDIRVLDAALKYGYESSDAFSVAFKRMHGMSPTAARKSNEKLKYYARLRFAFTIKGVNELNYKIVQRGAFDVIGKRRKTPRDGGTWSVVISDGSVEKLNALGRRFDLGVCFGYDEAGNNDYMCALEYDGAGLPEFESYTVPGSTWLVVEAIGMITENIVNETYQRIYNEFMPYSDYMQTDLPMLEKFNEWNETKNYCDVELWLPVKKEHEFSHPFSAF